MTDSATVNVTARQAREVYDLWAAGEDASAAQAALTEKLQSVTPAHPDAISAQGRVENARQALAAR